MVVYTEEDYYNIIKEIYNSKNKEYNIFFNQKKFDKLMIESMIHEKYIIKYEREDNNPKRLFDGYIEYLKVDEKGHYLYNKINNIQTPLLKEKNKEKNKKIFKNIILSIFLPFQILLITNLIIYFISVIFLFIVFYFLDFSIDDVKNIFSFK